MLKFVVKRNGLASGFKTKKLMDVISKVFTDGGILKHQNFKDEIYKVFENVCGKVEKCRTDYLSTDELNDYVHKSFIDCGFVEHAENFKKHREMYKVIRETTADMNAMSEYIFMSKYSRYIPELNRRETWNECVNRVRDMHIRRYPMMKDSIIWAFEQVRKKLVLPSMRSMQFAGSPIENNHARMYNCSYSVADRVDFFSETMNLLLCGCGVGFSVEKQNIEKLPPVLKIKGDEKIIVIEDSIEGWSDCIKDLFESYLCTGRSVKFDYSRIRPKGSPISSGGTAPGPEPLINSVNKIVEILDAAQGRKLKPIEVYDCVMHTADAVLAGGVRRSACICMFSEDDKEMSEAKTGEWFNENPQRGRSNNSVKLVRDTVTREQFQFHFDRQRQSGDPGFFFVDSLDYGSNPCQPDFATVLTKDGIREFKDISEGSVIWSETGWVNVSKKWSTGVKPVYRYHTTAGTFIGTENHRLVSGGVKKEAKDCESVDVLQGDVTSNVNIDSQDVIDGLVIGDGTFHGASNNVLLCVGKNDLDYFNSNIKKYIGDLYGSHYIHKVDSTITPEELPKTYDRVVPIRFKTGTPSTVAGFLKGLYSANGSVVANRVTLKSSSKSVVLDVQEMLSSIGIRSYYTTNKSKDVSWSNGNYTSRESYDLNISTDRDIFKSKIGFVQEYKNEKLDEICGTKTKKSVKSHSITQVEFLGDFEVYDITVDNEPHTYWTGGLNVSNCVEIGLNPFIETENGKESGFQFCNLTTMNGKMLVDEDTFEDAVTAAVIIGTCQAGYTDFKYVSKNTKLITERESLLGVSITGIMDNPDVILDPVIQRKMAKLAVALNKRCAKTIGIPQAARVTCVKPEGTTSVLLDTASGIHPRYARKYIRRVQANKEDPIYKMFKENNPHCCEPSMWSANGTDDVISFSIKSPEGAICTSDLSAIEFLEKIKSTQQNWVLPGNAIPESSPFLNHNVSNTVTVKEHEWDEVADYIYENRKYFTGIALLSDTSDMKNMQAPHEEIDSSIEEYFEHILNNYTEVDYTSLKEEQDNTTVQQTIACGGGACELK